MESGSRGILERMLPPLRQSWGKGVPIDLVSCYATLPAGFPPETRLYRVADYRGPEGRGKLYRELARNRLFARGHRLLRRAAHDQMEMDAGGAPSGEGFRHQ